MPLRSARFVAVIIAAGILVFFRLYLLPENGLPDFDTIANWQRAQQLASSDYTQLFHHRAPLFNVFFAGLSFITKKLHHLIAVNALLNVLSVLLLCRIVMQRFTFKPLTAGLLVLAVGMPVFMVHSSRYLTIESASLPIFALFLSAYIKRCEENKLRYWYQSLAWLALGIGVNYKMALAIPVVLVLEFLAPVALVKGRHLLLSLCVLLFPVLIWSLAGWALGLPWYRYAASYMGITRFNVPNAAMRTGKFQSDVSFYFRYLLQFESPLAWCGLLLYPILYKPWQYLRKRPLQFIDVLAIICFAFLAGMSLLLKAPRGLAFIYVPLYLLGFLCLFKIVGKRNVVINLILIISFGLSVFLCHRYIYRYSADGYPLMAKQLQLRGIKEVAQIGGNGLAYFGKEAGFNVTPVFSKKALQQARKQGLEWVVLDGYYSAINLPGFDSLAATQAYVYLQSPGLLSPLFYLEHAEFTGFGFAQTMRLRQNALNEPAQLKLIRLPAN